MIVNEANLSMDEIQELSYYLCHHPQRVARTSTVPVPVLHAHMMGGRVKYYSERVRNIYYMT